MTSCKRRVRIVSWSLLFVQLPVVELIYKQKLGISPPGGTSHCLTASLAHSCTRIPERQFTNVIPFPSFIAWPAGPKVAPNTVIGATQCRQRAAIRRNGKGSMYEGRKFLHGGIGRSGVELAFRFCIRAKRG